MYQIILETPVYRISGVVAADLGRHYSFSTYIYIYIYIYTHTYIHTYIHKYMYL